MTDLLMLDPDALVVVADADENDLLVAPAAAVERIPIRDLAVDEALLEEGVIGYVKKKYDEKKHPRWPKGTPKAGQFMRTGDSFTTADGKRWQVISTAGGKLRAAEASGSAGAVQHKTFKPEFDAVEGPGVAVPAIKPAEAKRLKGGNYSADKGGPENTTVVSPYVEPATHDPSIKLPSTSNLKPEEWQRFGELEQDYYVELMDRFGKWSPSQAQSMMDAVYAQYDKTVKDTLTKAFGLQYGPGFWGQEGGGRALNLAYLFQGTENNPAALKAAWEKYEKVKTAMDEMNEVVHWDLFNRAKAPDVVLFHGGGSGVPKYQSEFISGKNPIYAGFSQSYSLSGGEAWGSTILMTPVSIRHVAMSQFVRLPTKKSTMSHELEIAVGTRMKLDSRSVTFDSSNYGTSGSAVGAVSKWLHGLTANQPVGGHIVRELKDVWEGKGNIPIPPEEIKLVAQHKAGTNATIKQLPPALAAQAGALAHTLKYKSEDGSKEAAVGILGGMGLKPGDFVEGKQGTRYIVLEHPGDTANGLAYVKVEPNGSINYAKGFPFSSSSGNQFYRLDGKIDIPKDAAKAGFQPWTDEQKGALAQGAKKKLGSFAVGEVFKHEGTFYKVDAVPPGGPHGQVTATDLDTGKKFHANGLYESPVFVPKEGFVPDPAVTPEEVAAAGPAYKPLVGEIVSVKDKGSTEVAFFARVTGMEDGFPVVEIPGMTGSYPLDAGHEVGKPPWEVPVVPEPGHIFGHDGKKWTITNVLKNGTVKAKPQGGTVQPFPPDHPALKRLFSPAAHHLTGDKAKLKTLEAGTVVSSSPDKLHPYVVAAQTNGGKQTHLWNLETGELVKVSANKSYSLVGVGSPVEPVKPEEPKNSPPPPPSETIEYEVGPEVELASLEVGDKFAISTGQKFEVIDGPTPAEPSVLKTHEKDGSPVDPASQSPVALSILAGTATGGDATKVLKLVPKGSGTLADAPGPTTTLDKIKVGQKFKTPNGMQWEKTADGIAKTHASNGLPLAMPLVMSSSVPAFLDKGGLTVVGESAPAAPKPAEPEIDPNVNPSNFDMAQYQHGEPTKLADLPEGALILTASGLPAQIKSKKPAGGATVLALHNGKLIKKLPLDKTYTTLVPKAQAEDFDHDLMGAGDVVAAKHLQAGDQFHIPGYPHEVFQMVKPHSAEKAAVAKFVLADGTLSAKDTILDKPELEYAVHAHKDDVAPPIPEADMIEPPAAEDLPTPEHFKPYLHHKSGSKKFTKLSSLPVDSHVKDKGGTVWIVKAQQGHLTALSDGHMNYAVDSSSFVNANAADVNSGLHDGAPALSQDFVGQKDAQVKAAKKENTGGRKLGDLANGDYFVNPHDGQTYMVGNATGGGKIKVYSPTSSIFFFDPEMEPASVSKEPLPQVIKQDTPGAFYAGGVWHVPESFVATFGGALGAGAGDVLKVLDGDTLDKVKAHAENVPGNTALLISIAKEQADREKNGEGQSYLKYLKVGTTVRIDGELWTVEQKGVGEFGDSVLLSSPGSQIMYQEGTVVEVVSGPGEDTSKGIAPGAVKLGKVQPGTLVVIDGKPWTVREFFEDHDGPGAKLEDADGQEIIYSQDTPVEVIGDDDDDLDLEFPDEDEVPQAGVQTPAQPGGDVPDDDEGEFAFDEDYFNAPTWPADVPLPEQGDTVEYALFTGGVGKGMVQAVSGDVFTISDPILGTTSDIPVEDLVAPLVKGPAKMGPDPTTTVPSTGGTAKHPPLGKQDSTGKEIHLGDQVGLKDPNGGFTMTGNVGGVNIDGDIEIWPESDQVGYDTDEPIYATPGSLKVTFPANGDDGAPAPAPTVGSLEVGDRFTNPADGKDYLISEKDPTGFGWPQAVPAESPDAQPTGFNPSAPIINVKPAAAATPAPAASGPVVAPSTPTGSPLKPYGHHKSGTAKHHKLSSVGAGTTFTDKSKKAYKVVGHMGDQTVFEDENGNQFASSNDVWIKILTLQEGKVVPLRWTTGGTLRIAA